MAADTPNSIAELARAQVEVGMVGMGQGVGILLEFMRFSFNQSQSTVNFREAQGVSHVNESGSGATRARSNPPLQAGGP